jgi:hypothetical protein
MATISAKQVERLKNPMQDLTRPWGPDERRAAVEELGHGHDLCRLKTATAQESHTYWSPNELLASEPLSFHSTSTKAQYEASKSLAKRQESSLLKKLKRLQCGSSRQIAKSAEYIDSSEEEVEDASSSARKGVHTRSSSASTC